MASTVLSQLLDSAQAPVRESWMVNGYPVQRAARRVQLFLPVTITAPAGGPTHLGLTRDLSQGGIFVYSKFVPSDGAELEVTLRLPPVLALNDIALRCRGRVVRADQVSDGAAVGIAVRIEHLEVVSLVREEPGD